MKSRVRAGGAQRWVTRASQAGEAYTQGIKQPRKDWETATAAAEQTYKTAVTEAANKGMFSKGIRKAGNAAWSSGAINKGSARYPQGVQLAQGKYEAGIAPYLAVIEATEIPDRLGRGNPNNMQRASIIAAALNKKRTQG